MEKLKLSATLSAIKQGLGSSNSGNDDEFLLKKPTSTDFKEEKNKNPKIESLNPPEEKPKISSYKILELSFENLQGGDQINLLKYRDVPIETLRIKHFKSSYLPFCREFFETAQIENLNLSKNNLENMDLIKLAEYLAKNKTLLSLNLSHNKITALPENFFQGNQTPKTIILIGNPITEPFPDSLHPDNGRQLTFVCDGYIFIDEILHLINLNSALSDKTN